MPLPTRGTARIKPPPPAPRTKHLRMKSTCSTVGDMTNVPGPATSFDATFRFRCHNNLCQRFARIAAVHQYEESTLAREVMENYVAAEEKKFNLPPMNINSTPATQSVPAAILADAVANSAHAGRRRATAARGARLKAGAQPPKSFAQAPAPSSVKPSRASRRKDGQA